jgi:hypothetical protein
MKKPYDTDTYGWAMEQAGALKRRAANEIDWDNVAEEIESLGKQQLAELRNRFAILVAHLLKWIVQPERRSRSWRLTIVEQRRAIALHMQDNPSLRPKAEEAFGDAYLIAVAVAAREADLDEDAFAPTAPFSLEQALAHDWWPIEDGSGET